VEYGAFEASVKRQGAGWSIAFKRKATRRAPPVEVPPLAGTPAKRGPASVPEGVGGSSRSPIDHALLGAPRAPAPSAAGESGLGGWLARAVADDASDLIVSAGAPARLRLPGGLRELPGAPLDDEALLAALSPWMGAAHREALERHGSADLAFVWQGSRFRVNVFRQHRGLAAAFRPIRRRPPTLAELRLPESLARLVGFPNGLVLVAGPTGSGKSTTLAALLAHLGASSARHVITLEDPIEYELAPELGLAHQREVGTHCDSFEAGLRAALREAPDVIFVGEMRDRPTIAAAVTAAETGHLVLSTLHAAHSAMAVERIVDVFPEHQQRQIRGQLAGSLRAILTQHLLPGPAGRVPAIELCLSTPAVGALIREARTHQLASAVQTGRDDGMIPLDRSLADRVAAGDVALDAAASVTTDGGAQLRELLRRR
jgi:twitching motility protein PilT